MTLKIVISTAYKRDLRKIKKQGKNLDELFKVIKLLVLQSTLPKKYKDHSLIGNWRGHRECHIKPDWLLIYRIQEQELNLERTGSHSELFN